MGREVEQLGNNRVGGYLCRWGRQHARDGVWFESTTTGLTDGFKGLGGLPLLFWPAGVRSDKAAVVGLIDLMQADKEGLWIEAQIKLRQQYDQLIAPLVVEGRAGFVAGTLTRAPKLDQRTGKALYWPTVEVSIAPAQMATAARWAIPSIKAIYAGAGLAATPAGPAWLMDGRVKELALELERIKLLAL